MDLLEFLAMLCYAPLAFLFGFSLAWIVDTLLISMWGK